MIKHRDSNMYHFKLFSSHGSWTPLTMPKLDNVMGHIGYWSAVTKSWNLSLFLSMLKFKNAEIWPCHMSHLASVNANFRQLTSHRPCQTIQNGTVWSQLTQKEYNKMFGSHRSPTYLASHIPLAFSGMVVISTLKYGWD